MKKRKHKKIKIDKRRIKKIVIISAIIALIIAIGVLIFTKSIAQSTIIFTLVTGLMVFYFIARDKLKATGKIRKMETVFPDFLQLMASNLRAGMTTYQALLLSARKEFDPLDKEITQLGKDLLTGRKIEEALLDLSKRIKSIKIEKTIRLIVSGIQSGGNIATLLEETAVNMRERGYVEKRAASTVLMYVLFIFIATGIGAPILFGLSSILVEVMSNILGSIPAVETGTNLPFTLSKINISPVFITYFSLTFLVVTDIIGSLVIGLVQKGEEKEGIKFMMPLIVISVVVFFIIRIVLKGYFAEFFG